MLRNLLILSIVLFSAGHAIEAMAIPPILSQETQGEEAESIEIELNNNKPTGQAIVTGCNKCPLTLQIDAQTRFFEKEKPISRAKAKSLSGNSGTIIFKHDRTVRIRWW